MRSYFDCVTLCTLISAIVITTELAQLEERSAFNRVVVGSSPIFGVFSFAFDHHQVMKSTHESFESMCKLASLRSASKQIISHT